MGMGRHAAVAAGLTMLAGFGGQGSLYGAALAAQEVRGAPAALAAAALLLLWRDPRGLTAAVGWIAVGLLAAVVLRAALGTLGLSGWIPGAETSRPERIADITGLATVAALAWRGRPSRAAGPLLGLIVATTRIGAYGQALVPIGFEDTLAEAVGTGRAIIGGLAAGLVVGLVAAWALAILVRVPERWVAPGRALAALAAAAAIGHMLGP